MSILELQEKLIEKIKGTKEDYVLEEVNRLLDFESNSNQIYQLNSEQSRLLEISLKEIENGEFFTDEEVKKETANAPLTSRK